MCPRAQAGLGLLCATGQESSSPRPGLEGAAATGRLSELQGLPCSPPCIGPPAVPQMPS